MVAASSVYETAPQGEVSDQPDFLNACLMIETSLEPDRLLGACKGIERELAKKIVNTIKDAKLKVEAQINGDKLRVSSKKRDDLQGAMQVLRAAEFELPLQFENFRD